MLNKQVVEAFSLLFLFSPKTFEAAMFVSGGGTCGYERVESRENFDYNQHVLARFLSSFDLFSK